MSQAKGKPRSRTKQLDASREAKRLASAILEVLGGLRSPTEASEILGITPQRYYKLETRAVQGLLQARSRRPIGAARTPTRSSPGSPPSEIV